MEVLSEQKQICEDDEKIIAIAEESNEGIGNVSIGLTIEQRGHSEKWTGRWIRQVAAV